VGMTVQTLRDLGHDVTEDDGAIRIRRGSAPASRYDVPGDYSSAVPLLAAVTAVGGRVRLTGLRWPSADADARALPVLESMGLALSGSMEGLEASAPGRAPRPVSVRATDFPDAVPALAAVAAFAEGRSRFDGVGHLRFKESDRVGALAEILTSAGAHTVAEGDSLVVAGPASPRPKPVRLPTHRDHRMAMAAAILALKLPSLLVENPACVSKSYPSFFRDLERLCIR